jgi:hypothetical protein
MEWTTMLLLAIIGFPIACAVGISIVLIVLKLLIDG